MSARPGPAKYRAGFEAALEYGVMPLGSANYSRRTERERPTLVVGSVRRPKQKILRRSSPTARKTRAGIVTAEDILNHKGVV